MTASERLQAMLDVGMGLIPDLVRGHGVAGVEGGGDPGAPAPDLEAYLKATQQAAQTQLSINRLRDDEMNQAPSGDVVTPEAALQVLLGSSMAFRREAIVHLTESLPQKGMLP